MFKFVLHSSHLLCAVILQVLFGAQQNIYICSMCSMAVYLLIRFTDVKYFYHCHGVVVESGKMKKNSNFGVNLMMDVCKQDGKVWEGSCL